MALIMKYNFIQMSALAALERTYAEDPVFNSYVA